MGGRGRGWGEIARSRFERRLPVHLPATGPGWRQGDFIECTSPVFLSRGSSRPTFRRSIRIETRRRRGAAAGPFLAKNHKGAGFGNGQSAESERASLRLPATWPTKRIRAKKCKEARFLLPSAKIRTVLCAEYSSRAKIFPTVYTGGEMQIILCPLQGIIFAPLLSTDTSRRASSVQILGQTGRYYSIFCLGKL